MRKHHRTPVPAVACALFTVALLTGACAARRIPAVAPPAPPVAAATPIDIDALVRRGCYRCLEAALTAAAASPGQATEVALLLASRSKELGLPPQPWLDLARARMPAGPDWALYLAIVEEQPRDALSDDRDVLLTEQLAQRRSNAVYAEWRGRLTTGPASPVFRAYLSIITACRNRQIEGRDETIATVVREYGDVPILLYRLAYCGGPVSSQRLVAAREAEPELVDADLELGRRAVADPFKPDVVEGLRLLRSARAAFPASPVIPALTGDLFLSREEWTEALDEYDTTLALVPTHRDALLGRTISLSHLGRHDDAIHAATALIDLGSWFLGEAHYWRAWNGYQLDRMQEAREDADRAKRLLPNATTLVLSGMIEWREKRLPSAESELAEALNKDFGECDAATLLGGVRAGLRRWPESLAAYRHASQCLGLSIVTRRKAIAELSDSTASATLNARQIAAHERAITNAEERQGIAEQNAASIDRYLSPPTRKGQ